MAAAAAQSPAKLIVTGIPFSGASLVCSLLNRLPDVVAINEPEALRELLETQDAELQCRSVTDYFTQVRHALELRFGSTRPDPLAVLFSRLLGRGRHARLPTDNAPLHEVDVAEQYLPPDFTVAIKCLNPIACTLGVMTQFFRCCVVVRNPLGILNEWRVQSGPLREGREPQIEKAVPRLARRLDGAEGVRQRQIILMDWYFRQFANTSKSTVTSRYEDVVSSNGRSLSAAIASAAKIPSLPGRPLEDGNAKVQEDPINAREDLEALLRDPDHACWEFYRPTESEALLSGPGANLALNFSHAHVMNDVAVERPYRPLVDFMIVGAQKCGTTALWDYLGRHPEVNMSTPKEVHLFSSPSYQETWSPREIDKRYSTWFRSSPEAQVHGEVTPMYLFLPDVASELKRYNPELKLIVLLRDPVERTISHYYMQYARGRERAPIWLALLAEPWRLRRCKDLRGRSSSFRNHSYRRRSLYSFQLRNLYRHFSRDKVLVISSHDLLRDHQAVLRRVFSFLGVSEDFVVSERIAMSGSLHGRRRHPVLSLVLRLSFLPERWRGRRLYEL